MKNYNDSSLNYAKLILTLSFVIIFSSCKKDITTVKQNEWLIKSKPSSISQKISEWYKSELGKIIPKKIKSGNQIVSITTAFPLDKTQYFPEQNMAITPVIINKASGLYDKYLVNYFDLDEKIKVGFYIDILIKSAANSTSSNIEYICQGKMPKDFSGTIIISDVQGNNISSGYFENGLQIEGSKGEIRAIIGNNENSDGPNPIPNNPAPPEGCSYQSVDWYLVTFDDEGNILDIVYLSTSQVLTCPNNGGGGSSDNPPTAEQVAELIFASGEVKSEKQPPISLNETPSVTERLYPWLIYRIQHDSPLGIGSINQTFVSVEKGTRYLDINNKWRWQSFDHFRLNESGYAVGISLELSNLGAASQIYHLPWWDMAGMTIQFNPKVSFVFDNVSVSRFGGTQTTSNAWLSTTNGLPIPGDPQ